MNSGERIRATYEFRPVDHLVRQEFYIWEEALARWKKEGMPKNIDQAGLFNFDEPGIVDTGLDLGWCEPPFNPPYEEKIIETVNGYEIVQDTAGRIVKFFRGRRHGFMPTYLKHPVTDEEDWQKHVCPRLSAGTKERWVNLDQILGQKEHLRNTKKVMITQRAIGPYMYLRALLGPEDLLYAFYDKPNLVHAMMRQWSLLIGTGISKMQKIIELDEIYFAEDICYNHGLLISPDAFREFILPYYQEVVSQSIACQRRKIYLKIDTDGYALPAIDLYSEVGLDAMLPFEVAAGCDVVGVRKKYPKLIISGGIDKRVLSKGEKDIDKHLEYIIPFMVKHGGYIPTCDHGVPDDVSYENYVYYRKKICELDH